MIALALLVLVAALGLAAAFGCTADSRDPEYGVAPLLDSVKETAGNLTADAVRPAKVTI